MLTHPHSGLLRRCKDFGKPRGVTPIGFLYEAAPDVVRRPDVKLKPLALPQAAWSILCEIRFTENALTF